MISKFIKWISRHHIYQNTYRELASMSNRELNDIGIGYEDIKSIAYEAAYGVNK
jgi:uncharacterized protein YjiS (DUF1127 family)